MKISLKEFWRPEASSNPEDDSELKAYWAAYGGAQAIWQSAYVFISMGLALLLQPLWCSGEWTGIGLDLVPGLLGFSLGALAVMLAIPSVGVFWLIADEGNPKSQFMILASRLVHFIIAQVVSLLSIMIAKAYPSAWTNGIGFILMIYALLSAIPAALSLFGVARMLNFSAAAPEE